MNGLLSDAMMYGFGLRKPYKTEDDYFAFNPEVSGMAAEDDKVVLNPYSPLETKEMQRVFQNEAARLWMRKNNFAPPFYVTPEQKHKFKNTPYENNEKLLRQTLLARWISGDPSAGMPTETQKSYINTLHGLLNAR